MDYFNAILPNVNMKKKLLRLYLYTLSDVLIMRHIAMPTVIITTETYFVNEYLKKSRNVNISKHSLFKDIVNHSK